MSTREQAPAMPQQTEFTSGNNPSQDRNGAGGVDVQQFRRRILDEIGRTVIGLETAADQLLIALVAGGHVLLEGVPGTAKTTLCKTFAKLLGVDFHRIQFTPDLLPGDVTGSYVFNRKNNEFELRTGPIFCQMLLADELNRAPAKTQSSLLEAMQERQVTIEGTTLELPQPFLVLATQNPVEQEGVYRLPEAQLDRFLLRVNVGYPDRNDEVNMLGVHSRPVSQSDSVATVEMILALQAKLPEVHASEELRGYIVDLARNSRNHADVALGASPRAALYLMHAARARATLDGRDYATHEDVLEMLVPVLGHRIILRPEAEIEGRRINDVLKEVAKKVPVSPKQLGEGG